MSSSDSEIKNAVITRLMLGREDHNIPTAYIHLDYGGSGQAFGGFGFEGPGMGIFVLGVIDTLEVRSWEDLVGKSCRVKANHVGVHAIGHLLHDKWFTPSEALA